MQLIATPLLRSLLTFEDLPPSLRATMSNSSTAGAIAAKRSPLLTNGRGGEFAQERVRGMPLGDVFVALMEKAWDVQQRHRRESLSPKCAVCFYLYV